MIVQPHLTPHIIEEYEILFSNGVMWPVTLDKDRGDEVEFTEHAVEFHLAEKPSLSDPDKKIPSEDITIFTKHIAMINHRQREVMPPTPDQQEDFRKTLHKLHSTIQ